MIDAASVEGGSATNDAVYLVVFRDQELGKVAAVLPGDACDKSLFHVK